MKIKRRECFLNGKIFIAETNNGGDSWMEKEHHLLADSGEAFFAASGTNLRFFINHKFYLVSGGTASSFITAADKIKLPVIQGKETTGANSIDIYDLDKSFNNMIVVGGDFNAAASSEKNCFYSANAGKTWRAPKLPPHGYRSCVEYLSKKNVLSCGLTGVDYSKNGGNTWQLIDSGSYNVCRIAKQGKAVFLAGNKGTISKLSWR
jgi:hypothetical protein